MINELFARGGTVAAGVLAFALSSPAAHAGNTNVRLGFSTLFNTGFHLYMGAVAPELYANRGIEISLVDMKANAANCIAALLSNSVDLCSISTPSGIFAASEGAPIKAVAVVQGPIAEVFLTHKAIATSGVSADAPVKDRIVAMKGLNLVTSAPGTLYFNLLEQMLRDTDVPVEAVTYRTLVDQVAMRQGLTNGAFDAALWSGGAFADLEASGDIVSWVSVPRGDLPAMAKLPTVTVFASQTWLDTNPGAADNLHAALVDVIAALRAEPERYSRAIKAYAYPDIDQRVWDAAFKVGMSALWDKATVTEAGWNSLLDMQRANNPNADFAPAVYESMVLPVARTQ